MKIIILGAGRIGYSVAESLVSERNDITVIDNNAERLRELQERFDLRCVSGNGIDAQVLAEAGAADTDMLIACAAQDETNLVCCKIAHMVFGIPTRIARVRSMGFDVEQPLMGPEGFAVDAVICPEASLTRYISKLIEFPASLQVRSFAGGRASLASVRAHTGALAVGLTIEALRLQVPHLPMRVVALYRRFADGPDRFVRSDGQTRIEAGDEVFVLAAREHLKEILQIFHTPPGQPARVVRSILIAGGSAVGLRLAQELAAQPGRFYVKILDTSLAHCQQLAAKLPPEVLVLNGSAADEELLQEEHIEDVDFFLAVGDDDENNIMAGLLAKRLGARRVLALINQRSYADLMHGTQIDIALTPAQAMLGELLAYVRKGDVQAVHSLRRGVAEALEVVVRGDRKTSRVVGREVGSLRLPADVHIGLIVRGLPDELQESDAQAPQVEPEVIFPRRQTVLHSNDHVVFFLPHKRLVAEVERLFRVGATFF